MILKSVVVDDFFKTPYQVRGDILQMPMKTELAPDGVEYPGIVLLSDGLKQLVLASLHEATGFDIRESLIFARHSFSDMTPPHWAHSDKTMGDYTALIYMNEAPEHIDDGTYLVKHTKSGIFKHPPKPEDQKLVMNDSNKRNKWTITDHMKAQFNRCVILNSDYLHAAGPSYGRHRGDSRLVLTAFFRL